MLVYEHLPHSMIKIEVDEVSVMVEKDDWRLQNDVEYLKNASMYPKYSKEIIEHAPYLNKCIFCGEKVRNTPPNQWWFIPRDISCCICEECYNDFYEMFHWRQNWMGGILYGPYIAHCLKCGAKMTMFADRDYVYKCEKCKTLYDENFGRLELSE